MSYRYNIAMEEDEDGWWYAEILEVPGAQTQGRTVEEAKARVLEALEVMIGAYSPADVNPTPRIRGRR